MNEYINNTLRIQALFFSIPRQLYSQMVSKSLRPEQDKKIDCSSSKERTGKK